MNQLLKTSAEDTAIATRAFAPSAVVPIDSEPTPRLIVEPLLPGPLAQAVGTAQTVTFHSPGKAARP